MVVRATRSAVAAFSILLAACTLHRGVTPPPPEPQQITLEVDNRNWADIVVYVVHDGTATRFMTITGSTTQAVPLAPRFIGADGILRFVAHQIGGQDYYSPSVSVRTGGTIALTLLPQLNMSSVGVW